ncbi:ferrous iron transport protein B [Candidatus Micrarchaeota archaeon]|nr:ferrous iron transport protein B [Candidatus Micrarchaeota archaeon]
MNKIRIALAGNSNVGKSALFNYLTGLAQHVANWPGKTVELAEGTLRFNGCEIKIIDLPGIYSLSTFSIEERVTQEYILKEKPDVVINVIDSTAFERNLFFTSQLLELGVPIVVALNQNDVAKKKGMEINAKKLEEILGAPVVPTVATTGIGVWELVKKCIETTKAKPARAKKIEYGKEIEEKIKKIEHELKHSETTPYPKRYAAIKLLEGDAETSAEIKKINAHATAEAKKCAREIERIHGEPARIVLSNERYNFANRTAEKTQKITQKKQGISDFIDEITTHKVFGYIIMLVVLGAIFYSIFTVGSVLSTMIGNAFNSFRPSAENVAANLAWEGLVGGFVAGLTLVLPYVLPFYLLLSLLEDTGYITRVAYLLDGMAHKIGFHGKAVIPLLLGYGCNVPACFGCRIMEYDRDRLITAFAITLVPCTARTVVILALVAAYLGVWWAIGIYALNLVLIAILAKIAFKILPGEPVGLIMEMPPYRMPSLNVVAKQTWRRTKSLITIVFPYYIAGGLALALLQIMGVIEVLNNLLEPLTVGWLGLPALASTLLIFGIVRKEFVVVLPALLYNTTDLSTIFTPTQMVVLTLVTMLYIPCLATIEALRKEFGTKKALFITALEIVLAVIIGGITARIIPTLRLLA